MTNFDLPALLADADRLQRDSFVGQSWVAEAAIRLAAFVRSVTDETPTDARWLQSVSPSPENSVWAFIMQGGQLYYSDGYDPVNLGRDWTRGRVRLFAAAMGLELREG